MGILVLTIIRINSGFNMKYIIIFKRGLYNDTVKLLKRARTDLLGPNWLRNNNHNNANNKVTYFRYDCYCCYYYLFIIIILLISHFPFYGNVILFRENVDLVTRSRRRVHWKDRCSTKPADSGLSQSRTSSTARGRRVGIPS